MKLRRAFIISAVVLLVAVAARNALASSGSQDVSSTHIMGPILLALIVILIAAKIGSDLAARIGQPAVLGELAMGVIVGNLTLFGYHGLQYLGTNQVVEALAEIGVVLLLFEVGLETDISEMAKVGASSLLVALLGVIVPFGLGFGVAHWLIPNHSVYAHIFVGATLCATSVGITARVLKDLGKLHRVESKIILGAAVIDDVLGLVVLAIVQGVIVAANGAGSVSGLDIAIIIGKAVGFLALSVILGQLLIPRIFGFASKMKAHDLLLAVSLAICFVFAYVADTIKLAPIVGAFAAGLVLDKVHYQDFTDRGDHGLEMLLRPINSFLVPIFFVLMGIRVQLSMFGDASTLAFAGALSLAAIVGKQVCSFGVLGKGVDKILVGLGMIPRGEVGLIVAAYGATLMLGNERIVDPRTFSAVVIVVMLTTFVTPPLLRWRMERTE